MGRWAACARAISEGRIDPLRQERWYEVHESLDAVGRRGSTVGREPDIITGQAERSRGDRLAGDGKALAMQSGRDIVDITEAHMTDILIRDAKASRVGLSRAEYRRRALDRERTPAPDADPVTASHLQRFADLAFGLGDPEVMSGAWT